MAPRATTQTPMSGLSRHQSTSALPSGLSGPPNVIRLEDSPLGDVLGSSPGVGGLYFERRR